MNSAKLDQGKEYSQCSLTNDWRSAQSWWNASIPKPLGNLKSPTNAMKTQMHADGFLQHA